MWCVCVERVRWCRCGVCVCGESEVVQMWCVCVCVEECGSGVCVERVRWCRCGVCVWKSVVVVCVWRE